MAKESKRSFETLGVIKVTDSTELHLSKCQEDGKFKGYYLSKSFQVKDSVNPDNFVKVFAKNAYRVDTLEQLEAFTKMLIKAVKSEKGEGEKDGKH